MGCSEDTNRNLTTIGDQDLLELHDGRIGPQTVVDGVPVMSMVVVINELGLINGLLRLIVWYNGSHDGR